MTNQKVTPDSNISNVSVEQTNEKFSAPAKIGGFDVSSLTEAQRVLLSHINSIPTLTQ
jgi:hypothetical protein